MKRLHTLLFIAACLSSLHALAQHVEYFWDEDLGVGQGQVLQAFSGTEATVETELDASALPTGIHRLGLRAVNGTHFSATYYRTFFIPEEEETIVRLEYGWDKAPAPGKGKVITFTPGSTVNITQSLSTKSLKEGIHTLYLRTLTQRHQSRTYARTFYVPATSHKVEAIEYFFDDDPGIGNATRMAATTKGDSLRLAFDVSTDDLSEGVHRIGLRVLTDGTWSATKTRQFLARRQVENHVTRLEYFWDDDPGAGNGYVVDITPGQEVTVDFMADMYGLSEGTHTLGVRAQSGSKGWSKVSTQEVDFEGWDALQDYLNSLRDTQDQFAAGTYTRQFLNKEWQSLYVPFTMSYWQWSDHFDVARINGFYQYDDDNDGVVDRQVLEAIIVRPGNGSLRANYPYIIRAKTTGTYSFGIDADRIAAEETCSYSCSTMEAKYTFTGNYTQLTGMKTAGYHRLRGGAVSLPESDEEVLPPFRWYLTIEDRGNQLTDAPAPIRIRIVGEENSTDIFGMPIADIQPDGDGTVYDLQGRKLENRDAASRRLTKGVYIVDGKKVVR